MPKDKYILIGSDVSNALATIIKAISGYENYTCVTSVKSLGTIQLARSIRPDLIILYFRDQEIILRELARFQELKKIAILCLTHQFQRKEIAHSNDSIAFIQSYEDALKHNNLRRNVISILRQVQQIESYESSSHRKAGTIKSTYEYNNNLARYTLELDQKRAMLDKVRQKIKEVCIETDKATKAKLISLLNTLKISTGDKGHWEDFKHYFEDINPNFVRKLSDQFPKLTAKDIKYCCYLKMNMSNEDIRNLLGINQESVRTHKYRLKRKLTLSKEQNLRNFLHSFAS